MPSSGVSERTMVQPFIVHELHCQADEQADDELAAKQTIADRLGNKTLLDLHFR